MHKFKKKKKGSKREGTNTNPEGVLSPIAAAKATYKNTMKAVETAMLSITIEGAKYFKIYKFLLLQ